MLPSFCARQWVLAGLPPGYSPASRLESHFPRQPNAARVKRVSRFMASEPKTEPMLSTIQLMSAVLCADCEVISDSSGEVCSVCGSRSLLSLGRVLGGSIGDERAVLVSEQETNLRRMFTLMVNREASTTLRPSRRWNRPQQQEKSGS
jgi:hypothetical protein